MQTISEHPLLKSSGPAPGLEYIDRCGQQTYPYSYYRPTY